MPPRAIAPQVPRLPMGEARLSKSDSKKNLFLGLEKKVPNLSFGPVERFIPNIRGVVP